MSRSWFSESGRLLLGWDSPIPAGLFVAMLLPWVLVLLVALPQRSMLRWLMLGTVAAVSLVLTIALALTQSRGPILAAAAGLIVGWWYAGRLAGVHRGLARRWSIGVLISLGIASALAGAGARWRPDAIAVDGSLQNRLAIWRATPDLLLQQPGSGLGAGESGYAYSQWYQPDATDYLYRGVFNTYLQLGIEHGVWLFASLCGAALFLASTWLAIRHDGITGTVRHSVFLAANLSLLIYSIGSTTGVFTAYASLSAFACFDLAVCVTAFAWQGEAKALYRTCVSAALIAGAVTLAAWGLAKRSANSSVKIRADHTVALVRSVPRSGGETALVAVDREVLGDVYGKALRRLLSQSTRFDGFVVADPRYQLDAETLNGHRSVVLFGKASRFIELLSQNGVRRIAIVHPGTPPGRLEDGLTAEVWLSEGDAFGVAAAWKTWAFENGAQVHQTGTVGQSLAEEAVTL